MKWHCDRLPTADDADLQGLVRWRPDAPGLLMNWQDVRAGESWARTAAWQPPADDDDLTGSVAQDHRQSRGQRTRGQDLEVEGVN
jgi:hypothetical protein